MAQTYTRQSSFSDGDTITAALFNDEYNQLVNAFSYSSSDASATGHRHDGTAAQGGNIHTIGDLDFLNKIVVDSTNNRWGVYVEVSGSAVEQIRIQDGAIVPVTDNDIDLGTSSLEFKDLFLDGTATVDTLSVDANATVAGTLGVTGAATLSSTLALTGAATLSSTLAVTGTTTLTGNVTTTNDLSVGGNLTVTGTTTFNGGTITMGDAATDNVVFGANVDSHIIPDDDNTYDLGSSSQEWRDLYVDGTAYLDAINFNGTAITATAAELNILDGVTSTAAELNILDGVTATTAELNILDGVTSTAAELNILDGVTSTATELNLLDGVTATTAELNYLDVTTLGTVEASKAVVADANADVKFGDNDILNFGTGSDLQLYHDGSNSYIFDQGTGYLVVMSGGPGIRLNKSDAEIMIDAATDGAVTLYHDNAAKLATTATGIDVTGSVTADGGVIVDNITIDGTEIDLSSGDLTLDVAGDIILDADGGDWRFKDAGTSILEISNVSSSAALYSAVSDADMLFKGNDGGSAITALTLDMSAAGEATFNDDINLGDSKRLRMGAGGDFEVFHDGSNNYIKGASSDQDLIFQGVDGGSAITALTLDMSEAGAATFNSTVQATALTLGDNSTSEIPIAFASSSTDFAVGANGNNFILAQSTGDLDSNALFTVTNTGNVGIGTSSPDSTLHVHAASAGSVTALSGTNLTVEGNANNYLSLLSPDANLSALVYGSPSSTNNASINSSYNSGSPYLNFNTGGSEAMRIDSSGNLGVGTTSTTSIRLQAVTPTANHVAAQIENSNTADSFGLVVKGGNDANDYTADFRKRDNTNIMRIRGDGNVGINTTSPAATLHTVANSGTTALLTVGASGNNIASFYTSGNSQVMTLDSSGNLGIGTTSPSQKLSVVGNIASTGVATPEIELVPTGSVGNADIRFDGTTLDIRSNSASASLLLSTASTERMRIDSSGNAGIGTTSPSSRLTVSGSFDAASAGSKPSITGAGNYGGGIGFIDTNVSGMYTDTSGANLKFFTNQSSSDTAASKVAMTIDGSSNLLVGRTSTLNAGQASILGAASKQALTLQVTSDGNSLIQGFDSSGNLEFQVTGGGAVSTGGQLSIATTGAGNSLGCFLNQGTGSNFYEASDGTKTMIAGTDGSQTFVKIGSLSNHPVALVTNNTERVNIDTSGQITFKANAGASSHVFGYNEDGGEIQLLDNAGSTATLIDQSSNATRVLELINGSNLALGLGSSNTTGNILFYKGGFSEAMRINSSGNVGIGTTSPAQALVVSRSSGSTYLDISRSTQGQGQVALQLTGGTGGVNWVMYQDTSSDSLSFFGNSANRMTIDSSGNVSVTSSGGLAENAAGVFMLPTGELRVKDSTEDGTSQISIYNNNTTNDSEQFFVAMNLGDVEMGNRRTGYLSFKTNNSEAMRIDSSGNLFIGRTSSGNTGLGHSIRGGDSAIFSRDATGETVQIGRNADAGDLVRFYANGTQIGSIGTVSGLLGIGSGDSILAFDATGNAMYPMSSQTGGASDGLLDLGSSLRRFKDFYLAGDITQAIASGAGGDTFISAITGVSNGYQITIDASNNQTYKWHNASTQTMTLNSAGELLVGTTSVDDSNDAQIGNHFAYPKTGMEFKSNSALAHFAATFRNTNGLVGSISTTGSATAFNTSSDQRLKENIVDAPSASDDIDAIQVRSFDWKGDGSHQKYGMVAQELVTVAPSAVSQPEDPEEMMGVDYSKLVPMMLKEIQQLRARVAQLEGDN